MSLEMDWVRGAAIGSGSSTAVHLAFNSSFPPKICAVKSVPLSSASLLQGEEAILDDLHCCHQIIACFGRNISTDPDGGSINRIYNKFLEYADGGSISDAIQRSGGTPMYLAPESAVRREYEAAALSWVRGDAIGRGRSSSVHLAFHPSFPSAIFAVKSAPFTPSSPLPREKEILADLQGCPQIISFFDYGITTHPSVLYNLYLEYAAGGCIYDAIQRADGALSDPTIRRHVRSILYGLRHIHAKGYVHCDIKPQNILIVNGEAKIADFGLAKRATEETNGTTIRGTPMYLAPESVAQNKYDAAADIWALGCTLLQMVAGHPPWPDVEDNEYGFWVLMDRIGFTDELPEIPSEMSEDGKDFLRCCFVKNPIHRWTAEMLLSHPFVASSLAMEWRDEDAAYCVSHASAISVLGC